MIQEIGFQRGQTLRPLPILLIVVSLAAFPAWSAETTESAAATAAAAPVEQKLGDGNDGNRSSPVHLIEVFDEKGDAIKVDETRMNPVSLKQTCGKCHTYETIAGGWHFHAGSGKIPNGRIGEPWVIADSETRTQIPVSDRKWARTYSPADLGITPWQYLQYFGSHYPGGAYGEAEASAEDPVAGLRGGISGKFEINCLACHNGDSQQNQSDAALQAARQNYRWIASAASGLAVVKGTASELDDLYDPWADTKVNCLYDKSRFNAENKVSFNIVHQPPANRCYFCHSTQDLSLEPGDEWRRDADVHLAAGLTCADCHRNGANHAITRGDVEKSGGGKGTAATMSCRGCHLGDATADPVAAQKGGRLGAPRPTHPGIPIIHFDKLACTACHSGPMPTADTTLVRTARIHKLGLHGKHAVSLKLPHVQWPVFVRGADGKIAPNKLMWPAFWGTSKDGKLTPMTPKAVKEAIGDLIKSDPAAARVNDWIPLDPDTITAGLQALTASIEEPKEGTKPIAVYVAGGKVYQLSGDQLMESEEPEAGPYSWPIAHDVRPASQSLGRDGNCRECHSTNSPFFFGAVAVDSPVTPEVATVQQVSFQDISPRFAWGFAWSFMFRPWMKLTVLLCCAVVGAVILAFVLKAFGWFARTAAEED
jgi:hypothetical protein